MDRRFKSAAARRVKDTSWSLILGKKKEGVKFLSNTPSNRLNIYSNEESLTLSQYVTSKKIFDNNYRYAIVRTTELNMKNLTKSQKEELLLIESTAEDLGELSSRSREVKGQNSLVNLDQIFKKMEIKMTEKENADLSAQQRFTLLLHEIDEVSRDGENNYFKKNGKGSTYATLSACNAAVKPLLAKYSLRLSHSVSNGFLVTSVKDEEGRLLDASSIQLVDMSNMQKQASCITYARRYNICCLFNLDTVDDDGNTAVGLTNNNNTSNNNTGNDFF